MAGGGFSWAALLPVEQDINRPPLLEAQQFRDLAHGNVGVLGSVSGIDPLALDAFLTEHPEVGAVISQNRAEDSITATFSLAATNEQHALSLGLMIWLESGAASGLEPNDLVRVEIETIGGDGDAEAASEDLAVA